jgi:hypothetical protein
MIKQWMELVDYRITEGSSFQWQCYGDKAYTMDSWNGDHDGESFSIVFDTADQTVYELQAHDFLRGRAYRWTNPDHKTARDTEAKNRGVAVAEAWEDVDYVELEVLEDFYEKARAIQQGLEYDTRVQVPIDLSDSDMLSLMTLAHEADMTLNNFVEKVLREQLNLLQKEAV